MILPSYSIEKTDNFELLILNLFSFPKAEPGMSSQHFNSHFRHYKELIYNF